MENSKRGEYIARIFDSVAITAGLCPTHKKEKEENTILCNDIMDIIVVNNETTKVHQKFGLMFFES